MSNRLGFNKNIFDIDEDTVKCPTVAQIIVSVSGSVFTLFVAVFLVYFVISYKNSIIPAINICKKNIGVRCPSVLSGPICIIVGILVLLMITLFILTLTGVVKNSRQEQCENNRVVCESKLNQCKNGATCDNYKPYKRKEHCVSLHHTLLIASGVVTSIVGVLAGVVLTSSNFDMLGLKVNSSGTAVKQTTTGGININRINTEYAVCAGLGSVLLSVSVLFILAVTGNIKSSEYKTCVSNTNRCVDKVKKCEKSMSCKS